MTQNYWESNRTKQIMLYQIPSLTHYPSYPVPVNTCHRTYQYWTTPSKNTPPTDIHHHYESELAKLNKYFHARLNPIVLTTYRMESGLVKTTYNSLHSYKKRFYLTLWNPMIPRHKVVIKSIPSTRTPKHRSSELYHLGVAMQIVELGQKRRLCQDM